MDQAIPFFRTSDSRLQAAYSYGDPRGGSYPDPEELFGQDTELDDDEEVVDQSSVLVEPTHVEAPSDSESDDSQDDESVQLPEEDLAIFTLPLDDPADEDFDDTGQPDYDAIQYEEFPSSQSEAEAPKRGRVRGRGRPRGRGRGPGRPRASTRARGSERGRSKGTGRSRGPGRTGLRGGRGARTYRRRDAPDLAAFDADARRKPRRKKRKEPLLSPEFKRLNGLVTTAWMADDYDTALEYALEAIKLNPEVFPLHATIAEILDKKGRPSDAIGALFAGVHSSRNAQNWWYVVDRLTQLPGDAAEKRHKLNYCYSWLVTLNPNDYQARLGRARLYLEAGHHKRAKNDCEFLLAVNPLDGVVIHTYASVCMNMDEPETALSAFEDFIKHCTEKETPGESHLDWEAISSYVEILMLLEDFEKALKMLRRLARWILGRVEEQFWENHDDDREWDPYPDPRRESTRGFSLDVHDEETYGLGLPIEFRVRLGVLRILLSDNANDYHEEGLNHLEYLLSIEHNQDSDIEEYADLYKEAGDCLRETGHHSDALRFYEPLLPHRELLDSRFFFDIALCYQGLDRMDDVRAAINHIRYGENNPMAQIGLAKLYRAQGRLDLMWRLCLELKKFNMHDILEQEGLPLNRPKSVAADDEAQMLSGSVRKPFKRNKLKRRPGPRFKSNTARKQAELLRDTIIKSMYVELKGVEGKMKQGDPAASSEWMRIAAELYEEFQSQGRFFAKEKSKPYMGDGWLNRELRADGFDVANPKRLEFERPREWRNILLDDWAEFLSHYAVVLAQNGRKEQSADVIKNIENSTVIYPEPDRYFLVRVASLRRSMIVNDEEKALEECRWFSKRYELASDSCRLPSAVARAIDCNPDSFRAGPEQKFWMRQIKVMDFSLLDEKNRNLFHFSDGNRVRWTDNGRNDGNVYNLKELDPDLLALYGHQMLVGGSPITALNYYFRAYALKPDDAIINLCLGLAYIQLAFKRQSINRHYQLHQGLSFITRYQSKRMERPEACLKQEAEFNMGVIWHSLGLMHLALPAYDRCLELAAQVRREGSVPEEDFAVEAAYAKRCILATNGDLRGALNVTKEYLVL